MREYIRARYFYGLFDSIAYMIWSLYIFINLAFSKDLSSYKGFTLHANKLNNILVFKWLPVLCKGKHCFLHLTITIEN